MLRNSGLLEGAIGAFALGFAAFLILGCVSCQNKGSGPSGENWQAMYEALSEEEQAKLGDGLKSVATSDLSKETIAGSAFDSTYAIDAGGEELLFYAIVGVMDTTDGLEDLEKLGLELEMVPWSPHVSIPGREGEAQFSTEATFTQVMALAKLSMVKQIEAEADWHKDYRTLSDECRKKLDLKIRWVAEFFLYFEPYTDIRVDFDPYFLRKYKGIERRDGEVYFFVIAVVTESGTERVDNATLPQIIVLAKLDNMDQINVSLPLFLPPMPGGPE